MVIPDAPLPGRRERERPSVTPGRLSKIAHSAKQQLGQRGNCKRNALRPHRARAHLCSLLSSGPVEKSTLWLMDRENPDHMCLSCGKLMRLTRTIPGVGELPECRSYACKACAVIFTESMGRAEWRESADA